MEIADPLDLAYMAIGAKQALVEHDDISCRARFEGELDFIQACIDQVGCLDRAWQRQNDQFPGVWCYEVAEPFGYGYGAHLLRGGEPARAEEILGGIVAAATEAAG
ncbi:hypothetical protein [Lysobacter silvisoli]|uniref:hypothetical protein n=1 Tax=Lysobacter silvisoli TaxID=2293254 RepID=UPI000E23410B|nr:hypothetical protein [Lysobacter silvisoli]